MSDLPPGGPPQVSEDRSALQRTVLIIVAAVTIIAILGLAAVAGLLIRAELKGWFNRSSSGHCSAASGKPAALPPELFLSNSSGPIVDSVIAARVVGAFWPIEEKALANDDRATTNLIESGPAAEYANAISCEDQILGVQSLRTVRPANAFFVYVSRQTVYPVRFLAEVDTTVYGKSPYNAPGTNPPAGTKFVEYLVFVKVAAQSAWKVVIDTGWAGGWSTDQPTWESPQATSGPPFNAPPPRPSWIDPRTVPQALASYWQHWVTTGNPAAEPQFVPGYWTSVHGAELKKNHQEELTRGVVDHTEYFVELDKDGTYQFAVYSGVDMECFTVRYRATLTAVHDGDKLHQNTRRDNYTVLLAPGQYSTIVASGLHQSCAMIAPSPNQPLYAGLGPGIGIVGGQGGDTLLTGSP